MEGLGGVYGVLTGDRINDQEGVVRFGDLRDLLNLVHQLAVDAQSARGVNDDYISTNASGLLKTLLRDINWVRGIRVNIHANRAAEDSKLLHGGGTLEVCGDEVGLAPLLFKPVREFGGRGCLTSTLETRQENYRWWLRGVGDLQRFPTENFH